MRYNFNRIEQDKYGIYIFYFKCDINIYFRHLCNQTCEEYIIEEIIK